MNDEEVAIASNLATLDDLLKTKICKGKVIHCQFTQEYLSAFELSYIKRVAKDIGIKQISFKSELTDLDSDSAMKLQA